jgi:hypothetical protein
MMVFFILFSRVADWVRHLMVREAGDKRPEGDFTCSCVELHAVVSFVKRLARGLRKTSELLGHATLTATKRLIDGDSVKLGAIVAGIVESPRSAVRRPPPQGIVSIVKTRRVILA